MSIESLADDFEVEARRLGSQARLRGSIRDEAAWRSCMNDIAGEAQRTLIKIYKELLPKVEERSDLGADLEAIKKAETAVGDTA